MSVADDDYEWSDADLPRGIANWSRDQLMDFALKGGATPAETQWRIATSNRLRGYVNNVTPISQALVPAQATAALTDWLANRVTQASWDDTTPPIAPTICRIEGSIGALFAKGRISRLYGQSGSGKSWVAKKATLEVVSESGAVLYLDADGVFEDFRNHLKMMGITREDALSGRLHYVRVEGSLSGPDVRVLLADTPWDLVVLDGFNVALSVTAPSGKSGHDASEVDSFFASVLRPAENVGAAVLVIDHAKKGSDEDHGSVQKRNNLTGTDFSIKRVGMIAKGSKGHAEISLTPKDRPGWATSEQARRGKTLDDVFVYAIVDSTAQDESVVVTIELSLPIDMIGAAKLPELNKDIDTLRRLLIAVPDGFESNSKVRIALKERGWDMDNNRINRAASALEAGNEAWRANGRGGAVSLKPGVKP